MNGKIVWLSEAEIEPSAIELSIQILHLVPKKKRKKNA